MNEQERNKILEKSKEFFREEIVTNHIKNIKKLSKQSAFNINPFTHKYLAKSTYGDTSPESLAKVLILPRVLGTSISTIFGTKMQDYCGTVLSGNGSLVPGMDIEFIDCVDNKKKYCQIKSGPQTINRDDVKTITDHFKNAIRLGRTNNCKITSENCVVGVLYGEESDLSAHYREINKDFPVFTGREFWYRLTGDKDFYDKLADAFAEAASDIQSTDVSDIIESTIKKLAKTFETNEEDNEESAEEKGVES